MSGTRTAQAAGAVPSSLLKDEELNASIAAFLPNNYSFEIHKTIHHVQHYQATCVALQMPEGLTLWATAISDIIERFTDATTVIMGDVTYGACCVDDFTARALGADLLVHYGHSCLVPVDQTSIRTLYVFVEIAVDPAHICATIRSNFPSDQADFRAEILDKTDEGIQPKLSVALENNQESTHNSPGIPLGRPTHLVLVATVQFINVLHNIRESLESFEDEESFFDTGKDVFNAGAKSGLAIEERKQNDYLSSSRSETRSWHAKPYRITIPQIKPLSSGEILGCTSPNLPRGVADSVDAVIYIGDGRFHLESIMIANPEIPAFRYDPYEKRFVREGYDHVSMRNSRSRAVEEARNTIRSKSSPPSHFSTQKGWGLVLGTLGRQGSTRVLDHLQTMLRPSGLAHIPILLSELSPQKLALFGGDLLTFVQTSCPRLSIDWGEAFARPLLSPYEAAVALGHASGWRSNTHPGQIQSATRKYDRDDGGYPMDFYADQSLGPWTPRHGMGVRSSASKGLSNRELLKRGRATKRSAAA